MNDDLKIRPSILRMETPYQVTDLKELRAGIPMNVFPKLESASQEQTGVLILNRQDELTHIVVFDHHASMTMPDVAHEVYLHAGALSASTVVVAQSRCSRDATPSPADVELVRELRQVGKALGVTLADFVIVARGTSYSMNEHDWCQFCT